MSVNIERFAAGVQKKDVSGKSGLDNMQGTVYISDILWRHARSRETKQ